MRNGLVDASGRSATLERPRRDRHCPCGLVPAVRLRVGLLSARDSGAPIGSAVAGTKDFVARARRVRKLFGGAWRQAGVLAAAALYALEHNIPRLADDHRNAQVLAEAVRDTPGLRLDPPEVETNLVWFEVDPDLGPASTIARRLQEKGVLVHVSGPATLRACTHLDVSAAQTRVRCRNDPCRRTINVNTRPLALHAHPPVRPSAPYAFARSHLIGVSPCRIRLRPRARLPHGRS